MKKIAGTFFVFFICLLFGIPQVFATTDHSAPNVVVSIKPLHSLVAGVMQGVSTPYLIMSGSSTPHSFTIKPSTARELQKAQLVFWAGENLEVFLRRPLANLASQAQIVALSETEGLQLWPVRSGEKWESDHDQHDHASGSMENSQHENQSEHEEHEKHADHVADLDNVDPHIWLDPINAKKMILNIVQVLSQVNPEHALQYQRNGEQFVGRLDRLHQTLISDMKAISHYPYMVFHDSYQYFEKRYQLNPVGSIVFQTDQMSSAKRLRKIQKLIKDNNVSCVFSEPQFSPRKVNALIRGTGIKSGLLDPLGADLSPGPELYHSIMINLGQSLKTCLGN